MGELVRQVIITPAGHDGDPHEVEFIGKFVIMGKADGMGTRTRKTQAENANVVRLFAMTVKKGQGDGTSYTELHNPIERDANGSREWLRGLNT